MDRPNRTYFRGSIKVFKKIFSILWIRKLFVSELESHTHKALMLLFYLLSVFQISLWAQSITEAPQALTPKVYITEMNPVFQWGTVLNADRYEFLLADEAEIEVYIRTSDIYTNSFTLPSQVVLQQDKVYHWRVRGVNTDGVGPWSETLSFMIYDPSLVPQAQSPFAYIQSFTPQFSWSAIPSAMSYELILTDDAGVQIFGHFQNIMTNSFVPNQGLLLGNQVYHWKVRSHRADGTQSIWSLPMGFLIVDTSTSPDTLSPYGYISTQAPFEWTAVSGALDYQLQLLNSEETEVLQNYEYISDTQLVVAEPLVQDLVYHWRVRARLVNGEYGAWSASNSFKIFDASIVPEAVAPFGYLYQSEVLASWSTIDTAVGYELEVRDEAESVLLFHKRTALNELWLSEEMDLEKDKVYHWRVRSILENSMSEWSAYRGFAVKVDPPAVDEILPVHPLNGVKNNGRIRVFVWEPLRQKKASYYFEVYLKGEGAESEGLIFKGYSRRSNKMILPRKYHLFSGRTYYWRVSAVNSSGEVIGKSRNIEFEPTFDNKRTYGKAISGHKKNKKAHSPKNKRVHKKNRRSHR